MSAAVDPLPSSSDDDPNDPMMTVEEFQEVVAEVRRRKNTKQREKAEPLDVAPDSPTSRSPVRRFLDAIPPGLYLTSREVAEELGVSSSLIRKIARDPALNAPSKSIVSGKFKAYLYTKDDVLEVREYLRRRSAKMVETRKEPRKEPPTPPTPPKKGRK